MKKSIYSILVKPALLTLILFMGSGFLLSQSVRGPSSGSLPVLKDEPQQDPKEQQWPRLTIGVNPAGLLTVGPVMELNVRIAKKTYLGAYYINHYLGIFNAELMFGESQVKVSPVGMGGGLNVVHYFKPNAKLNAFYADFYAGYSYNECTWHSGYPNEGVGFLNDLYFYGGFGYHYNLGKRFFLRTGIQFGVAYAFDDKYYHTYDIDPVTGTYVKKKTYVEEYSGSFYPGAMPDFTFGINF